MSDEIKPVAPPDGAAKGTTTPADAGKTPPADAGKAPSGTPGSGGQSGDQTLEYWKAEAQKAFQVRDELKAERPKLAERAAAADKYEKEKREAEEKAAADQGKWKELYDAEKAKREQVERDAGERERKLALARKREALTMAYRAVGGIDVETFEALTEKSIADNTVAISEDGRISGAEDVVKRLKETKPHLFGAAGAGAVASPGTAGARPTDPTVIKRGATREAIDAAWKAASLKERTGAR